MSTRMLPICAVAALLGGCVYHSNEMADRAIADIAARPVDREPTAAKPPVGTLPPSSPEPVKKVELGGKDIQTGLLLAAAADPVDRTLPQLKLPESVPGMEVPLIPLTKGRPALQKLVKDLYPPLDPLPELPKALPGPDGKPYTLAELQELAALNSPTLKQAVADVRGAEGALLHARAYPNPILAYSNQPSNDGSTASVQGFTLSQHIITAGKGKLSVVAAQKDFDNAQLALRRARSDLATAVRSNYFGLLVAKEAVRVNHGLSVSTDAIYRFLLDYLDKGGFVANYEPAPLRAQAYMSRAALQLSINNYIYAWKQLTYSMGVKQLPLSEVAGRIDVYIPYFEYDSTLNYVLANHTDVLTARNTFEKSQYLLKQAQILPVFPDFDVQLGVYKEFALPPTQFYSTIQVGAPIPIWDTNKGNIIAAEAAMIRASEEPHRASLALANNYQNAYNSYKNNLVILDYYRRHILPDQVRAYRGVLQRRVDDPNAQPGDLVTAQQNLLTSVAIYLSTLGQLWSSVVTIADFLQTDDLFQFAEKRVWPQSPDIQFPCTHPAPTPAVAPLPCPDPVPTVPAKPAMLPPVSGAVIQTGANQTAGDVQSQDEPKKRPIAQISVAPTMAPPWPTMAPLAGQGGK